MHLGTCTMANNMKKNGFLLLCSKTLAVFVVGISLLHLASCCPGDDYPPFKDTLKAYLEKDKPSTSGDADKYSAYFDFSDGMQLAYADNQTKEVLQGIVQKVTSNSEKFVLFSLADNKITPLPEKMTTLFNTIMDANSYKLQNAPIEKTLEQIVNDNKSALMITDFEEYTGTMEKAAFATPYFKKWLEAGNDITFFVTDYMENGKDKHLYYIVFDNPKHNLLKLVEDGMQGKPQNYKHFLLSTSSYAFTNDYPSAIKGGSYRDSSGDDNVSAVIENGDDGSYMRFDSLNVEYYPLGQNWADLVTNAKSLMEEGVPEEDKFSHLLSKLYLDLSKLDSYNITGLDLKVSNIEKDFAAFSNNFLALQNKGTENEANYYDESGKLLPDYEYKPSAPVEVKDMLVFDKDLFAKSLSSTPNKVELAVNLDPKFNGSMIGAASADMLRVDIIITDCEPKYDKLPELFQWTGNDNLFESVKNTLQDMRPTGRIIYSYFIRFAN